MSEPDSEYTPSLEDSHRLDQIIDDNIDRMLEEISCWQYSQNPRPDDDTIADYLRAKYFEISDWWINFCAEADEE